MTVTLAREELARAAPGGDCAVTIGVFDGVHRGHQHLVGRLLQLARGRGLATAAVTFHPHPRSVLRPGSAITYLCTLEERVEQLRSLGLDAVAILSFTSELAQLSPRDFLRLLVEELRMRLLLVGPDFALGRNREGTVEVLRSVGEEMGFQVEVAPLLTESGQKVGSTAIRRALAEGDVETVARLLGRPFSLRGPVVEGARRGERIGFPTANIALGLDRALPALGVYITRAYLGESAYPACTNIGLRPTFHAEPPRPTVETHILDFRGELYGRELRIDLLKRLRPERKFPTVDDLIAQIRRDIEAARRYFGQAPPGSR